MRTLRSLASWALALFLIAAYVHLTLHPLPNPPVGHVQLYDLPGENILFATLAERSGYVMFEPTGRFVVAILELIAAFLLLLPWSRRLGAFMSSLILLGAVGLHVSTWLGREIPASLNPGETATDGGALFALTVAMLVASILVFVIHPGRRKIRGR